MRRIEIVEVSLNSGGKLLVVAKLPAESDYRFIYRTATGVRWLPAERALTPADMGTSSPQFWFNKIVHAVQDEYGDELVVTDATKWTNIPESLRLVARA